MIKYLRNTEAQAFRIPNTSDYTTQGKYTFTMRIGGRRKGQHFTKSSGIVADTSSSIKVTFTTNEIDNLLPGVYRMELYANNVPDSTTELVHSEPFFIAPGLL